MFFLAAEAEGTRNKAVHNSGGNAVRDRQEKSSTVFFLAAETEGRRKKAVLNNGGNAVRDRQEKSSTVFVAAEGTRNQSVLKSWGNTVRDDRRKEQLRPREQETRLFLTAGGTLFEIDRRKASVQHCVLNS